MKNKNKIKLDELTKISISIKEINKILLLHFTNNLVCSFGEKVQIFENINNKSKQKELNLIQEIIDPNFNEIHFLYETKRNSNNNNYLLLCSDMIHVYYLYQNDKKSMLLQSINQFDFQYINKCCETKNGNLISVSNEYKISIFNNNLIKCNENIDYSFILNSGNDFIEKFREEIYELEKDKLNKDNEKIYYALELYPDKLAYVFCIKDDESFDELNTTDKDINDIDADFIYIKFIDKNYNKIKELKICDTEDDYQDIFQFNEKILIFINDNYLNLIDLKYYEIVTKIMINKVRFTYPFQRNIDYSKNNYINYLLLAIEDIKNYSQDSDIESDDNDFSFEKIKININNLTYILNDFVQGFEFEYKNENTSLNSLLEIYKILELSITGNKDKNNIYYCVILCVCKNEDDNDNLKLIHFKFEVNENK